MRSMAVGMGFERSSWSCSWKPSSLKAGLLYCATKLSIVSCAFECCDFVVGGQIDLSVGQNNEKIMVRWRAGCLVRAMMVDGSGRQELARVTS